MAGAWRRDPQLAYVPDPRRRSLLKGTAGVLALSGFGGALLSACGGSITASDGNDTPTPRIASVANFRDVGGAADGYPTVDGLRVKRGVFYRSDALTLSDADKAVVNALNIVTVYDLRTPADIAQTADVVPVGAGYVTINVEGTPQTTVTTPSTAAEAVATMQAEWSAFVTSDVRRAALGAVLSQLNQTTGTQLFHSGTQLDIAGWVAALLLSIANAPFDVIMQDYLLTNGYASAEINASLAVIREQQGDDAASAQTPLYQAQESYLQAAFQQVQANYGTVKNYLTTGLGLADATVSQLRTRLVLQG